MALVLLVAASAAAACGGPEASAPADRNGALASHADAGVACTGLVIDGRTRLVALDPRARPLASQLASWLAMSPSQIVEEAGAPPSNVILVEAPKVDATGSAAVGDSSDALDLEVAAGRAHVGGATAEAAFHSAQELAILAGHRPIEGRSPSPLPPSTCIPATAVRSRPVVPMRAMHLDTARHYFAKDTVKRYIDLLAFYRFNTFHWHLTDDQGFRIQIRSHPELTEIGAVDGFYSQDDVRDVVRYAQERSITVIPEIEMPGHTRAILASHPELSCTGKKQEVPKTWGVFEDVLCAGNPAAEKLMDDVLTEVAELFPGPFVHIGGDEVPKTRWNECPKCRARMAREKLNAEQLEGALLRHAGETLAARGKRIIVWDEAIGSGIPKNAVIAAWRGADRIALATRGGHDVIAMPYEWVYFNYWQSRSKTEPGHEGYRPWMKVLELRPMLETPSAGLDGRAPEGTGRVVGAEAALWTEHVRTQDEIETLLLPRLAALSAIMWRPEPPRIPSPDARDRVDAERAAFVAAFSAQRPILDASRVKYFVEPPGGLRPKKIFLDSASVALERPALFPDAVVRYTRDGSEPTDRSLAFSTPFAVTETTTITAALFLPGGRTSPVVKGVFEKVKPTPAPRPAIADDAVVGASYKYYEGDFHALPDFTKLAPRKAGSTVALGPTVPGARKERYALAFEARIQIVQAGLHRFVTRADDGVRVIVDGAVVLEDDGEHAPREADGEAALEVGVHDLRLEYFQGKGGASLSLGCEAPGAPLGECRLFTTK